MYPTRGIVSFDHLMSSVAVVFTYNEKDMLYIHSKLKESMSESEELDKMYLAYWDHIVNTYYEEVDDAVTFPILK